MQPAVLTAALVLGVLLCSVGTTYGKNAAFCKNYPKKPCGKGFERLDSKRCIRMFWARTSFYGAMGYCRRFSGHLASIHSDQERNQVACTLWRARISNKEIWIGIDRFAKAYNFIDGSPMNYGYWSPLKRHMKGSKRCVAADYTKTGEWGSTWCSEKKNFVCTLEM